MIKINLATKKQASYVANETATAASGKTSFKEIGKALNKSGVLTILYRMFLPLTLSVVSYFAFNYFIQVKTEELQMDMVNIDKEKTKIEEELRKFSGFQVQKAEFEKTEKVINAKISTVEQLIKGKDHTVKAMIAITQILPKDIWLTQITATESTINLHGNTVDIGLISDLMAKMGTSIYFKDVDLKQSTLDANGHQAEFEMTARRE